MSFDSLTKNAWHELQESSFQATNKFNLFLYKNVALGSLLTAALDVVSSLSDSKVVNVYLQSITFPPSVGFTYERLHEQTYVTDIAYPGDVTMTFIETEGGDVMRFLKAWMNDVYAEPTFLGSIVNSILFNNVPSTTNGYVLKSNQIAAKRTGLLLLQPKAKDKYLKYPRIMLYGLKIASIGEVSLDQKSTEPLTITATFNVERVYIPTLI